MRKHNPNAPTNKAVLKRAFAMLLAVVLMTQALAFGTAALVEEIGLAMGELSPTYSNVSGIGNLKSDEITAQLKKDLIKSFNQELVKRVDEYEMSGPVGVIITFSDDSVITAYTESSYYDRMTYASFKTTGAAKRYQKKMLDNQNSVLDKLLDAGLIDDVKYNYVHLLDGAYVATTYENLNAICNVEGVGRVMISNTYEAEDAVTNPVDVDPNTGIFNSSVVSYTGKGTLVAVLDSGCDYSHTAFTSYAVKDPAFDRAYVEGLLESTKAYALSGGTLEAREVYYGNITNNKIAFGYDYADKDADIMPFDSSHGTHVAGIIAGKDETITGVAIDAQLAIMKVFSDYTAGAEEGDIIAALEDSIILGVDAINMSLGSSCGFTYESAADKAYKNDVYNRIEQAGISLIVAASNDYSSGFGSEQGNTNKTDNPDSATVGSPSTYDAAMSVASISGTKDQYMLANGNFEVFFNESSDTAGEKYDFFAMLGIVKGEPVTYDYVAVPGYGMAINYQGIDVNGKIALVKRGDITFEEKVQYAQEAGAIAVIIYNNVFGDIMMTIGNNAKIPAVSIGKDEGDRLAAAGSGTLEFDLNNLAGPFMSDFSSWGPNPDLSLKPEITAHGGNILSAVVGGDYDELSGTSMAAPNMCGITVLIRQYVKEKYPEMAATEVRDLVNQLCMSTATIALDKKGNPYSPRKQGAGIADIAKATTTPAYLYVEVDGVDIGKTKLELGDDPARTGVYTMTVKLKNISDASVSYLLGNIAMTESVSTSEPEYVAEMAYLLNNSATYAVEGATRNGDVITVAAGATATVTATLTLSDADKSYINATFENGMYVEGFLTFTNTDENGVDLNAPFLAFYGDWGEAPIFDLDYYEVETEAHNNAIDDEDKIKADYYATTPTGSYYFDYILPLGSYVYQMDNSLYDAIPATMDKAAISYYADSISGIYGVFTGLLRGAKEMKITMTNTSTGEVVWEETQYNCYKAHYNGSPYPYIADMRLPTVNTETGTVLGDNNAKLEVTMEAKLDWDGGENLSDTYTFSFYIDYQAPTVTNATFHTEYDKSAKKNRYYLDMMVYDNHYAMSCRPIIVYDSTTEFDEAGNPKKTYASLADTPIPIYQETRGTTTKVTMEITDYLDLIADSSMPNGITIYMDDYAMNSSVSYIPFPGTENEEDVEFVQEDLTLDIHQTADLTTLLAHKDTAVTLEPDYLKTLKWQIKDDTGVITLKNGQIEAQKSGTAIIAVTSDSWIETQTAGGITVGVPIYKYITVNVTENEYADTDKLSGQNVAIKELSFSHYDTLFAFNSDVSYSEIGSTGSTNYFGGNYSIACYPSESIQLFYELKPWNLDPNRCEFTWSSSNPSVATVDDNGVVVAESEGRARITLNIKVDGKTSILAARLSVEVKSEFIIENRTLVAYKGKGGNVVIPDDEGILYIGSYAFSHYDLDNEKEVEKDENGYYDMDDKKTPLGNDTVTSVTIPEGVQTIQKHAFWGCTALREVKLPESCETISEYAFTGCELLENVNFDHVKIIADYAFKGCKSLTCDELGGANMNKLYAVGQEAFASTRFSSLSLPGLSKVGIGAFSGCTKLASVTLGQKTRISKEMFKGCESLKSVEIYSDTIGDNAFEGCVALTSVTFKNDLTYVGDSSFLGCKALNSVTFCGVVEQIAPYAFYGCAKLKTLNLPNCEIAIGDGAFAESGLTKVTFANNTVLSSLGVSVFSNVGSGFTFDVSDSLVYTLESDKAVYTKDMKTLVLVLSTAAKEFTVPAGVTTIGDGAFSTHTKLTKVSFASGSLLTTIGNCAFANCQSLSAVNLPANAITIGDYAFLQASALKAMDLSKVSSVGNNAFELTALTSANLAANGVVIGDYAFYGCSGLKTLTLGAGATVGDYAFCETGLVSVDLLGDAKIGMASFALSQSLVEFDFADVTGTIGDYAFYGCVSLKSVVAPKITEIGESAFSDCYSLETLVADSLVKIGNGAFAPLSEETSVANALTHLSLPSLKEIGDGAFYYNITLKSLNAPKLQTIGATAFYICIELESITFSTTEIIVDAEDTEKNQYKLTVAPEMAFAYCVKLTDFDYSTLVTIGDYAFCGVPLPQTLNLQSVETIGVSSFLLIESEEPSIVIQNNLVSVIAPKLKKLGTQAFAACDKLESFSAPSLESIGAAALAYTALEKFEVSDKLTLVEQGAFEGCENFSTFFALVNNQETTTVDLGQVKLVDGVLYLAVPGGYSLASYPAAKESTELTVMEGTVRIDTGAVMNAKNLQKVTLPSTLKAIGDYAFYGCDNLTSVVFRSYFAPVLEGAMSSSVDITAENLADFPGFEVLYSYDYFYRLNYAVTMPLYYHTFIDAIGSTKGHGISATLPANCEGYDTMLYLAYFDFAKERGETTMGKYAVNFIDAVQALPEAIDRFDKLAVENAIFNYNAMLANGEEVYVDESVIAKYEAAVTAYNVDRVESLIDHLFDMDKSEYSFNKVKAARAAYLALTEDERALVSNKVRLDDKLIDIRDAFGVDLDFTKEYSDYVTEEENPPTENPPANDHKNGLKPWAIVLIVVSTVLVAGGVAVFVVCKKNPALVTKLVEALKSKKNDSSDNNNE